MSSIMSLFGAAASQEEGPWSGGHESLCSTFFCEKCTIVREDDFNKNGSAGPHGDDVFLKEAVKLKDHHMSLPWHATNFRWTSSRSLKFLMIYRDYFHNGRGLSTRRTQFTLHSRGRYQTGGSTMTPTQREAEQKHNRGEISEACRADLLDGDVCAEQGEHEKSVSVFFFLTVSPLFSVSLLFFNHNMHRRSRGVWNK